MWLAYKNISIIFKERTKGGLNKRATIGAPLFSTLLVFPNWTKSRPVYGDSISHILSLYLDKQNCHGEDDLENPGIFWILGRDSPYPNFVSTVFALSLVQALLFRCVTCLEHTLYDTFPPQHGHIVTSFLYSILIACTLSSFLNRLRNSRQPIRFLQTGISFRLLWLLRSP